MALDRVFRIDFYPLDWLTLTSHQTPEQRGIFINICAMIYANRKPIDNDPKHIARASNCSPRLVRAVVEHLLAVGDLILTQDKKLTQKRCERELNAKRTVIENGANGGRKSSEQKRESNKNNDITSSQPQSSLPSSSPPHPHPIDKPNGLFPLPPTEGVAHAKPPRKKPTSRIPDDFCPDASCVSVATELGIELGKATTEFIDYWKGRGDTRADWQATFRNRLRDIAKYREERGARNSGGRPGPTSVVDSALRAAVRHTRPL